MIQTEDLELLRYVKRWLGKYVRNQPFNSRIALNQIITIYNVFDDHATGILYDHFRDDQRLLSLLKTLLLVAERLPPTFQAPKHSCSEHTFYPLCGCEEMEERTLAGVDEDQTFKLQLIADITPTLKKKSTNFVVGSRT